MTTSGGRSHEPGVVVVVVVVIVIGLFDYDNDNDNDSVPEISATTSVLIAPDDQGVARVRSLREAIAARA